MCEPVSIALAVGAVSTIASGYQAKQKGKQQEAVSKFNARQLENQAIKTRNKGVDEENRQRQKTAELLSRQRARFGASNVALDSGSPLAIQEDTETIGEIDALRIRSNFLDEAQVIDDKADITEAQGKAAAKAGNRAFNMSLLSGIGQGIAGAAGAGLFSSGSAAGAAGAPAISPTAGTGVSSKWFNFDSAGSLLT
jgi:hypothetical protein